MTFPFITQGTIAIDTHDTRAFDQIVTAVEAAILSANPATITRSEDSIRFQGVSFSAANSSNQLVAIGWGELHFLQQGSQVIIRYRLSFTQLFIVVTAMVTLFGILPRVMGHHEVPTVVIVGFWLWLFGGNYVITLFRFPRFLRNAAQRSLR